MFLWCGLQKIVGGGFMEIAEGTQKISRVLNFFFLSVIHLSDPSMKWVQFS